MVDNEIDATIMARYEKHPIKKEYFKNKWKDECKKEEFKSSQMQQAKEAYMRSKIYTLKTNANQAATKSKRKGHRLAESKQMENKGYETLTDSIKNQRRQLEYTYIKELEKRIHAEEGGKNFDESTLEKSGRGIEKLEAVLGIFSKEEENIIKKEKSLIPTITIIKFIALIYGVEHILGLKFLYL